MASNDDAAATSPRNSSTMSVELNLEYESAHRFPGWLSLSAFSAICLAALKSKKVDFRPDESGETWVLSVCIISMVLSFVAVLCYLCCRGSFVGQIPEVAIVSTHMDTDCHNSIPTLHSFYLSLTALTHTTRFYTIL